MKIDLSALARRPRWVVGAFFGLLVVVGLALFRDYGISIDEGISRRNGHVSLAYIADILPEGVRNAVFSAETQDKLRSYPRLNEYVDRDYGVVFALPAAVGEYAFGLHDERLVYFFRHLLTFLVCVAGVGAVYQLATRRFRDWRAGLLAAGLLVLSPRLFAESFYNSKDAVFMAFFAIATNTLVALAERPNWRRALWHALACAVAIDVRLMAVVLPVATVGVLALRGVRREVPARVLGQSVLVYAVALYALVFALWPFLWHAPLPRFVDSLQNMTKFRWPGYVLYRGEQVSAAELPWHYSFTWIVLTTPLLHVFGIVVGTLVIGGQLLRRHWRLYRTDGEWQDLVFLALGYGPILAVIGLKSVIYDGWRHLYFVYPALLLVAVRGLLAIWHLSARAVWRWALGGGTVVAALVLIGHMISLHPYENVYFSPLAARSDVQNRFELDYWCLTYRRSLEWIVAHDDRPAIKVRPNFDDVGALNLLILPEADRRRIVITTDFNDADYFFTNYRGHPQPYAEYHREVFSIRRDGLRLASVFRLR